MNKSVGLTGILIAIMLTGCEDTPSIPKKKKGYCVRILGMSTAYCHVIAHSKMEAERRLERLKITVVNTHVGCDHSLDFIRNTDPFLSLKEWNSVNGKQRKQ